MYIWGGGGLLHGPTIGGRIFRAGSSFHVGSFLHGDYHSMGFRHFLDIS